MGNLSMIDRTSVDDSELESGGGGGWKVKPDGWYLVMATEALLKPNNAGTGQVVHVKFSHVDNQYAGQF